jgi:hypothetical protein
MVEGWDAVLMAGLYLLKQSSEELLQFSFEDILLDI